MYGLPQNFDATIFVGRELIQVCFSANTIDFAFSDGMLIQLESSFIYLSDSTDTPNKAIVPVSSSSVMHLITHKVDSATARSDGMLVLFFDNGHSLAFLDDSRGYESYSIRTGDRLIIV